MHPFSIDDQQLAQYHADGYLIVRDLFDAEEIGFLAQAAREDAVLQAHSAGRADGEGGFTKLTLWNHPGDDIYGMFARCGRIVSTMEALLGGEVYHYHSKMNMKEPRTGGAWAWHQDYGYWYNNGCLYPLLASCMIPLDVTTPANGCLQVLKGSHLLGRINHGPVGDQTGANPDRVEEARKVLERVYCEMNPGDALFFHCNLLHRSDQNKSDKPRWTLICCYNAARNNPYREHHHPRYIPLKKVPDSAIKEVGAQRFSGQQRFWHPSHEAPPAVGS